MIQVTSVGGEASPPKLAFRSGTLVWVESLEVKVCLQVGLLLLHHRVDVGELLVSMLLPFLHLRHMFRKVPVHLLRLHIQCIHPSREISQIPARGGGASHVEEWRHAT